MNSQILTFYSTHHALAAEKALKEAGVDQTIVPTPRQLSANCGIAIRIADTDAAQARHVLESAGIKIEGMHPEPDG